MKNNVNKKQEVSTTTTKKELTKEQTTTLNNFQQVSSKVRYLNSLNYTTSEIKNILNIRYQHVRNVLITPVKTPKNK